MELDVVVIGGIGIDTNVYLQTNDIDFDVEANFTENMDNIGQAGGYYTRGFAQLGYRTGLIDTLGKDFFGDFIRDELKKDNVNLLETYDPNRETRRSVNFMYKDGRRKNFYDGKAHMNVHINVETCLDFLRQTKFAHFNLMNWSKELLPVAKELGLTISCDLQDIVTLDDEYRQAFINYADVLLFSAVNYIEDLDPVMKYFLKRRPELILLSGMGSKGCALGTKDGIRYFPPVEKFPTPIIDTNGAGDSLGVGFLTSYFFEGYSLEESVQRGQIAARHVCSQKASSSNLITKSQLDNYFREL